MADLMQQKRNFRVLGYFISHLSNSGAPCLDQLQILKYGRQNTIPDLRSTCAKLFNGKGIRKWTRAHDLKHVIKDGHLDVASQDGIIPVNDGIYYRLPDGLQGIFPAVFPVYLTDP